MEVVLREGMPTPGLQWTMIKTKVVSLALFVPPEGTFYIRSIITPTSMDRLLTFIRVQASTSGRWIPHLRWQ